MLISCCLFLLILKKVSDVIDNGVVKKTAWNELINFNVINTTKLVKKEIKIIK